MAQNPQKLIFHCFRPLYILPLCIQNLLLLWLLYHLLILLVLVVLLLHQLRQFHLLLSIQLVLVVPRMRVVVLTTDEGHTVCLEIKLVFFFQKGQDPNFWKIFELEKLFLIA